MTEWKQCDVCDYQPTRGTNAYIILSKCTVCGHIKKEMPDEFVFLDQESCPHLRTSHFKSTRNFIVTWCKDCGLVVDRRPRAEVEEARAIAKDVEGKERFMML